MNGHLGVCCLVHLQLEIFSPSLIIWHMPYTLKLTIGFTNLPLVSVGKPKAKALGGKPAAVKSNVDKEDNAVGKPKAKTGGPIKAEPKADDEDDKSDDEDDDEDDSEGSDDDEVNLLFCDIYVCVCVCYASTTVY